MYFLSAILVNGVKQFNLIHFLILKKMYQRIINTFYENFEFIIHIALYYWNKNA